MIQPEALRAYVEFLADDALEGRGTDFAHRDTYASQEGEFSGPVVFVGFGIVDEELSNRLKAMNEYAGLI